MTAPHKYNIVSRLKMLTRMKQPRHILRALRAMLALLTIVFHRRVYCSPRFNYNVLYIQLAIPLVKIFTMIQI